MNKIIKIIDFDNKESGYLYFYIHFVTEVACFYCLTKHISSIYTIWIISLVYDALAFVPQAFIGKLNDKNMNINFGLIGMIILGISLVIFNCLEQFSILTLVLLCIGNCMIHVRGAEITLRSSHGKMSQSGLFVGGGSFGTILGKLFSAHELSWLFILLLVISTIPFILEAETIKLDKDCSSFSYHNKNIKLEYVVLIAFIVVIVRGYIGYGIPTTWKKTELENVVFYFSMGFGKVLGGYLIDSIGIKKTAYLSLLLAIPFLIVGNNYVLISILGVMLFSLTMCITLALLVSALPESPGLAFGITTIGLFIGTLPIFFVKITSLTINCVLIVATSILCLLLIRKVVGD